MKTTTKLPDGDGSEMVTLAAGACPVIMMTSHGNEQIAVEAMKIGAQDYIVKSAETFEALPRTVAQALKVWSLRKVYEKELQQKNAEPERFTYTVSHDLKSPIITIKGFTGSLERDIAKGILHKVSN